MLYQIPGAIEPAIAGSASTGNSTLACDLPIVENLASKDVSPNAPGVGPLFASQPVVPQGLGVEVIDLITRVVDVSRSVTWFARQKEALFDCQHAP